MIIVVVGKYKKNANKLFIKRKISERREKNEGIHTQT